MKDWTITELLSLGTASAFILAIVYVYGYSTVLGLNVFAYFSISDYLRLSIEWLTPVFIILAIGGLITKFFTRIERDATEEELIKTSSYQRFMRAFRKSGDVVGPVAIVIIAILYTALSFFIEIPRSQLYILWAAAGAVLWVGLVRWYAKEPRLVVGWSDKWFGFILFFPALAIFTFFGGKWGAESGYRVFSKATDVQVVFKAQGEPFTGQILFLLDEYVLLRRKNQDQVIIVPKAEIKMIVHGE